MLNSLHRILYIFYAALLGLLFGIILVGQILGFSRIYFPVLVIPFSLLAAVLATTAYLHCGGRQFFRSMFPEDTLRPGIMDLGLVLAGLGIVFFLVVLPLVNWPFSPISETLHWDAGIYHFPKALEMLTTGSAWDMTISYGEYPFGYESLIAFAAALTRNGLLFGSIHALIALFLFLSIWLLACRSIRLAPSWSFFGAALLLVSGLFKEIDSNIWWINWSLIATIGKNDLFLGAALIACILHSPLGLTQGHRTAQWHPLGLAASSLIALSTKPNAALLVIMVWLFSLITLWKETTQKGIFFRKIAIYTLVMLPGVLWVLRNLFANGRLFTEEVLSLQEWSIASNLTNPYFYQNIPQHLIFIIVIWLVSIAGWLVIRRPSGRTILLYTTLFLGFILTPASAFFGSTQVRAEIGWRFAIALLGYTFVVLLILLDPISTRVDNFLRRWKFLGFAIAAAVVLFSFWVVVTNRHLLTTNPKNEIVLLDQFREPVGVGGYHSAFAYLNTNVQDSVVIVENGLPFYAYGPGYTNSTTRAVPADYFVIFQTNWFGGGVRGYPDYLNANDWNNRWVLVYEDSQGKVYRVR